MRKAIAVLYYIAIGALALGFGLLFNVVMPDEQPTDIVYFIGSDL
jgi:hypothetical protein